VTISGVVPARPTLVARN